MLLQRSKKNHQNGKGSGRLLITVNVLGSAGPIRFLINEEELVAAVIDTALKSYAREGRLPVLGSDLNNFLLYCANAGSDALSPWETIGSNRGRSFVLCKKQPQQQSETTGSVTAANGDGGRSAMIPRKGTGSWKAWFNKSLNLKIYSH